MSILSSSYSADGARVKLLKHMQLCKHKVSHEIKTVSLYKLLSEARRQVLLRQDFEDGCNSPCVTKAIKKLSARQWV